MTELVSPGRSSSPLVCGSGRRTRATPVTRPATRTSTRPTATYTGTLAQAGHERNTCHHERSLGPGSTGLTSDWSVMVLAIVPYHWQSSESSASGSAS